jgi:hypothetical protein
MQEIRELVGSRADMTEHLGKMRDRLLGEAKIAGKPVDKQRLHGRAEGVQLVLDELAVWTQTAAAEPGGSARQDGSGGDEHPF